MPFRTKPLCPLHFSNIKITYVVCFIWKLSSRNDNEMVTSNVTVTEVSMLTEFVWYTYLLGWKGNSLGCLYNTQGNVTISCLSVYSIVIFISNMNKIPNNVSVSLINKRTAELETDINPTSHLIITQIPVSFPVCLLFLVPVIQILFSL